MIRIPGADDGFTASAATALRAARRLGPGGRGAWLLVCLASAAPAPAQEDDLSGRPAFSRAEQPARQPATCADLGRQLAGLSTPPTRIDLAIGDALTLVQTDGALWYLAVCHAPGPRVLCVTYDGNGMKLGDRVVLRGGYNRQDEAHVVLDPCLASRG